MPVSLHPAGFSLNLTHLIQDLLLLLVIVSVCVFAAKLQPSGAEESPPDRTVQRLVEESKRDL